MRRQTENPEQASSCLGLDRGGELLAEYAANGTASSPLKEYGYRNGQLLVTAEPSANIHWLVTDQLGTPRMIVDRTGSYASVSRHDYLPFGEELYAGVAGRTTGLGYVGDNTRQKFTGYEADAETGLNFAQARYQSSAQGRFTSVDPLGASASVASPQSFNRYSYVQNNPTNATDPSGMMMYDASMGYSDYAGMWTGAGDPSLGGFETGRSIIGEAMSRFDQRVADTIFANGLNALICSGRLTRDQAEAATKGNDNLAIETEPEPQIVFDSVELLDDPRAGFPQGPLKVPRAINPIRSAITDAFHPNEFTLDVDHPEIDPNGMLAIRVKLHVIDGSWDTVTVNTTERESRRWRVAGGPVKTEGGIIFHANVYDPEAKINPIVVTVRAQWIASIWDKGKLNDVRYKSAEAKIILRIGPKDR